MLMYVTVQRKWGRVEQKVKGHLRVLLKERRSQLNESPGPEKIRIVMEGLRGEEAIAELCRGMVASDVTELPEEAMRKTKVEHVPRVGRPRRFGA